VFRLSFALLAATALSAPAFAQHDTPEHSIDGVQVADASDTIVVTGQREKDAKRTSTATKTDTPLQDVPQAVTVITAQDIADQAMTNIADVLRTVPGATNASGEGHRDQILLRGQNTTADFFVDGIRDDVQYYRGLYNLDRVEVLKGPNAMIFGRGGGGGIVNRVTKKAGLDRFADGVLSVDSQGSWGTTTDLETPLASGLGARLNAAYEHFDSFRDHVEGHRIGLNPTLGWQIGDDTHIEVAYEYSHDRRTTDRGIPSFDGRPAKGFQEQYFGDPDVNRLRFDANVGDLAVNHRFSDAFSWSGKARVGHYDKFYRNALAATAIQANDTVGMEAYQSHTKRDAVFIQNDFIGEVDTGGIKHTLLVGADYGSEDTFSDRQQGFFDAAGTIQRLFVPIGSSDDLPTIFFRDSPVRRATAADTDATAFGLYAQDQATIGEHFEIIAGLRRDWFKLHYDDGLSTTELTRKDSLWSPRLGLVLKPMPALSIYASWSKSFLPQSGDQFSSLTVDTAALEPEKFVNKEVGLKWAATPHLDLTIAAYKLERTNTRATDPVTLLTVLTGAQRSKGIEFTANGRLSRQWSLTAAAALQDAEIRRTTAAAAAGQKVASVPHFTSSLWSRYDFTDRLGAGLGLYHQSKMYASISNLVEVPGFTRVDAAAYVGLTRHVELQLNVENLFDKDYVGLANSDNNLTPANPRTVRATLRFGF
jgi:catecholate siderophore receptor